MVASRVSSSTVKLTWSAPASGPAVDHYVISARSYKQNLYRKRFFVPGTLTSASARVVEDLGVPSGTPYYISVAAIDATGHESLYAYPEYRCDASNNCSRPSDALNVTATR
jgi:hypothetical protein